MFLLLFVVLLCAVCTEALTEIVVKSMLFKPFRELLDKLPGGLFKGASRVFFCGHCFSVWAALFIVCSLFVFVDLRVSGLYEVPKPVFGLILVLVVHRLSNYLHMFVDRYVDKYYARKE